jgi:hypothetical protein
MERLRKKQQQLEEEYGDEKPLAWYDYDNRLQGLQQAYDHAVKELWLHKQARARLLEVVDNLDSEAKEYWDVYFSAPPQHPEGYWKLTCQARGGCCERNS